MRWLVLTGVFVMALVGRGQDQVRVDSLRQQLTQSNIHDTIRIEILNTIAWEYRNSNMDSVLNLTNTALELCQKLDYNKGFVRCYFNIGNVHYITGNYAAALDYYFQALRVLEKSGDRKGEASALMGIANIYDITGDYEKAIELNLQSLAIREEMHDTLAMADSYNNLGAVYQALSNYEKALEYHSKSMQIKLRYGLWKGLSSTYGNMGSIYKNMGDYVSALEYQTRALNLRDSLNNRKGMSLSYQDIGEIYFELGSPEDALENFELALELAREVNYASGIMNALNSLTNVSADLGDWQEAFFYYKEMKNLQDSIYSIQKATEIERLQKDYTTEQDQQRITMLEQDQEIAKLAANEKDALLARQKYQQYTLYAIIALVLSIAFFVYRSLVRKKQDNRMITEQKLIVEEKNKEILDSINYAERIQKALLKPEDPVSAHLPPHFILFKPKDIVSGDFYWAMEKEGYLYLTAADCTGHGVPGAFMSMLGIAFLNEIMNNEELPTPGHILNLLRDKVIHELGQTGSSRDSKDGMDMSLIRLELATGKMVWAGANNSLYYVRDKQLEEIRANKESIGFEPTMHPFTDHELITKKGDQLYLFTDGYADQFGGPGGKKFKYRTFKELLLEVSNLSMDEQRNTINERFEEWRGDLEQLDDVCVVGLAL